MRRVLAVAAVLVLGSCTSPAATPPAAEPEPVVETARAEPAEPLDGMERVAGSTRVETAVGVSARFWRSAPAVVLATAADFPDALAAGALAAELGAPLLLTTGDSLPTVVSEELTRLDAQQAIIVGGEAAVSGSVAEALRGQGVAVGRISGPDRYTTAARVTAEVGGRAEVVLASGHGFADALAAAPRPVLLTEPGRLTPATARALRDLAVERVLIVGGDAAVSGAVEDEVRGLGIPVRRVAGADRYATALALLADVGGPAPVVVVGGDTFADALPAGALAGLLGGPVALSPRTRLTDALDGALRDRAPSGVALVGGAAALSAHVESELRAVLDGRPRPLTTVTTPAGFRGVASPLPDDVVERMVGVSWRDGCPVGHHDLAYLEVRHHGLDGARHDGELVVAAAVAGDVLTVFSEVFDAGFAIERMRLVDDYGGDDRASMDANNTSGFNCRPVEGGSGWSEHAYGTAIDINPVQNPYRRGDVVLPEAGRAYLDRSHVRPGMIVRPGPVVDAFGRIGWAWGGDWTSLDDWMHFSASGR
jgi:putative cell wall-binding protein